MLGYVSLELINKWESDFVGVCFLPLSLLHCKKILRNFTLVLLKQMSRFRYFANFCKLFIWSKLHNGTYADCYISVIDGWSHVGKGEYTYVVKWVFHSKMVVFVHFLPFFLHVGSTGPRQEPKHIYHTACTLWRPPKPNKICDIHDVRSPLKGHLCEKWRIFSNFWPQFGLKSRVVNTRGWHRNGGKTSFFFRFQAKESIKDKFCSCKESINEPFSLKNLIYLGSRNVWPLFF